MKGHDKKRHEKIGLALLAVVLGAAPAWPQGGDPLMLAAAPMRATLEGSLRFSGAGSSYTFGRDAAGEMTREYARVLGYSEEASADGKLRTETVRQAADSEEIVDTETLDADAPWAEQVGLWLNPRLFLRRAAEADVEREVVRELGLDYTVVSFETLSGHTVSGYIDPDNILRRIRTRIEDPVLGEQEVEGVYLEYADFDGIRFPGLILHKLNGSPTLVVVVDEVEFQAG